MQLVVPENMQLVVPDLCNDSMSNTKVFAWVCVLVSVVNILLASLRFLKWVMELVSDFIFIKKHVVTGAKPGHPQQQQEVLFPRGCLKSGCYLWSLDWNDLDHSVHIDEDCFQLKGAVPSGRMVCSSCVARKYKKSR